MAQKQKVVVMKPDLSCVLKDYPGVREYRADLNFLNQEYPTRRVFIEVKARLIELGDELALEEGGDHE